MIVIKAITIGLFLFASESVANLCSGRWNGEQLPNPSDCSSFYVCNFGEPKLFKCLDNLLYDPLKRVCNWAYLVTCGQAGTQEHIPILPNPPYYPQPYPEDGQDGQPTYSVTPQQQTQPPYYPTYSPSTSYTANPPPLIDNPNVPDYSHTSEFYPGLVESIPNVFHCSNPEFYFAPHPRSCEKYFICENYRIHAHQCGEGIHWDYVFNQCDFPVKTFCYAGPNGEGVSIDHIEHIIKDPEHIEVTTVGVTGPIAIASIEPSTAAPSTAAPSTAAPSTAAPSTAAPSTAAPSTAAPLVIECPGTQAFIAHAGDCHKYFICIGGIPIVTSCPEKMAWDKEMAQCNEEAWLQCFG